MHVLFLSAECYPAAKAGGLGDVVGTLPKYLVTSGIGCSVVIPMYATPWITRQKCTEVYRSAFPMGREWVHYSVQKPLDHHLGFDLHLVHIPGMFDRPGIYQDPVYGPYWDETKRSFGFQLATLHWVRDWEHKPDIIHCHDHSTGLVPFLTAHSPAYANLSAIPTVFTIHNGAYQGSTDWGDSYWLPPFPPERGGLIEWGGRINPLAAALKNSWAVTTVSEGYLRELMMHGFGLEWLLQTESAKSTGIINGIDTEVWDPSTDPGLVKTFGRSVRAFKEKNKEAVCKQYGLDADMPLVIFIGRLVYEKGADMLPAIAGHFLTHGGKAGFIFLGTGDAAIENQLRRAAAAHPEHVRASIMYDEQLSHQLYAACDFLLMPSRTEPCGLNQMYTMRYGGIPVVRATGGLRDTVTPIEGESGNGYLFHSLDPHEITACLRAACALYDDKEQLERIRRNNMKADFSWDRSAARYIQLYNNLLKRKENDT